MLNSAGAITFTHCCKLFNWTVALILFSANSSSVCVLCNARTPINAFPEAELTFAGLNDSVALASPCAGTVSSTLLKSLDSEMFPLAPLLAVKLPSAVAFAPLTLNERSRKATGTPATSQLLRTVTSKVCVVLSENTSHAVGSTLRQSNASSEFPKPMRTSAGTLETHDVLPLDTVMLMLPPMVCALETLFPWSVSDTLTVPFQSCLGFSIALVGLGSKENCTSLAKSALGAILSMVNGMPALFWMFNVLVFSNGPVTPKVSLNDSGEVETMLSLSVYERSTTAYPFFCARMPILELFSGANSMNGNIPPESVSPEMINSPFLYTPMAALLTGFFPPASALAFTRTPLLRNGTNVFGTMSRYNGVAGATSTLMVFENSFSCPEMISNLSGFTPSDCVKKLTLPWTVESLETVPMGMESSEPFAVPFNGCPVTVVIEYFSIASPLVGLPIFNCALGFAVLPFWTIVNVAV